MTNIDELPPQEIKHSINLNQDKITIKAFGKKLRYIDDLFSTIFLKKYFK